MQLAAAVAFLIARYFARERILKLVEGNKKFLAIDKAIGENGFKVVTLLRLSPLLPFSLGNYLYGLTSVKFLPYVLGRLVSTNSCSSMIPVWYFLSNKQERQYGLSITTLLGSNAIYKTKRVVKIIYPLKIPIIHCKSYIPLKGKNWRIVNSTFLSKPCWLRYLSTIVMQLVGNASRIMGLCQCWCIWTSYNCKFLNTLNYFSSLPAQTYFHCHFIHSVQWKPHLLNHRTLSAPNGWSVVFLYFVSIFYECLYLTICAFSYSIVSNKSWFMPWIWECFAVCWSPLLCSEVFKGHLFLDVYISRIAYVYVLIQSHEFFTLAIFCL